MSRGFGITDPNAGIDPNAGRSKAPVDALMTDALMTSAASNELSSIVDVTDPQSGQGVGDLASADWMSNGDFQDAARLFANLTPAEEAAVIIAARGTPFAGVFLLRHFATRTAAWLKDTTQRWFG